MSHHNARAIQVGADWHGSCSSCGWFGRKAKDEASATRSAERHNKRETAVDAAVAHRLWGKRPHA